MGGVALWFICMITFTFPTFAFITLAAKYLGVAGYIAVSAIVLKTSFAIKSWNAHMIPVSEALESKRIDEARALAQKTVRRDLSKADDQHVISATVETIAEGTVDGYTSPIFFFALFGTPGAIAYRMINTLDSIVGYRDREHIDLGWFSAKMDTVANYLPARITGHLILVASALLGENWKRAKSIFVKYRKTITSLNAGWPMSAMAGVLGVRLEKAEHYALGEPYEDLTVNHIHGALRIMKVTAMIFTVSVVVPLTLSIELIQKIIGVL